MIARIPAELRSRPQWVVWKSIPNSSSVKPTKLPLNPVTLNSASSTDHATWSTFLKAYQALANNSQLSGLGFVFTESDPYVGVDLDNCKSNTIKPEATNYINLLDSYTEVSPSGHGFHVVCKGRLPAGGHKNGWVEMYESGRYFCFTGDVWQQHKEIAERTKQLAELYSKAFCWNNELESAVRESFHIPEGVRHEALLKATASAARAGISKEEVIERVAVIAAVNNMVNPTRQNEIIRMIDGAYGKFGGLTSATLQVDAAMERTFLACDYANWGVPDTEWLVPGLFPKGRLILLAGQSQTGKSIFMMNASIAMALGRAFSAFKGIKKSRVTYLVLEDPMDTIKKRLRNFYEDFGEHDDGMLTVKFAYNFSLEIESIRRMLNYIVKNNVDVIVIDTYQRATPGITSYNDEKQSVIVQSLAKVCRQTKCTIICIDHLRKLDDRTKHFKKRMSLDDVKGSVGKVANSDTVLLLDRDENKLFLEIFSKDLEGQSHYVLDISSHPKYQVLTED